MSLSDHDWQLLNALHDGELDRPAVRALQARLREEPALQAALADLREISTALKPLRSGNPAKNALPVKQGHWRVGALAAVLAIMAFGLGFTLFGQRKVEQSPLDWHQSFLDRQYSVVQTTHKIRTVAQWVGHQPDLSSANLTFVDVATSPTGEIYFHYSGVNGCRLTVGAHSKTPDLQIISSEMRVHVWSSGAAHYSMLAQGMDAGKFAAILLLLEEYTREGTESEEMMAVVRSATQTALPCA